MITILLLNAVDGENSIMKKLAAAHEGLELKLRVAFLGFRDVTDGSKQFEYELAFTGVLMNNVVPVLY